MISQKKLEVILERLEALENSSPRATQIERDRMASAKRDLIGLIKS